MYEVKEINFRVSGLTKKTSKYKTCYQVISEKGLYAELDNRDDAEIVAYGLNKGFQESYLGGFSDAEVEKIKKTMAKQS